MIPQKFRCMKCLDGELLSFLQFYSVLSIKHWAVSQNTTGRYPSPRPPPKSSHLKTSSEGVAAFVKGYKLS